VGVWEAVGEALGSPVEDRSGLGGGDINVAHSVTLTDGRRVFVKTNASADPTMFPAEARGLAWLAEANALRIPEVLAASPDFLALELLTPGERVADFDERLGRGLARLHKTGAPSFGLDHDNFIGRLPQSNTPATTWAEFYEGERLLPQLERASAAGLASAAMRRGFDALFGCLTERVGPDEPPARLHGDLWGGNLHVDEEGRPCLIDPAVYGGHREMDLAMMRLFGGFSPRVFAAYHEAYPLAPGWEDRVPLYQLYPLMVHVNLFGRGYVGSVEGALRQVV
jgi:fructosamine-3-kinase